MSSTDLPDLGIDEAAAEKVSALVFHEAWPFHGGSGWPDGLWERSVSVETRHLLAVEAVEDYLEVQARLRYGEPPAPPEAEPSPPDAPPPVRRSRALGHEAFLRLVFKVIREFQAKNYFVEAFDEGAWHAMTPEGEMISAPPDIPDPDAWLMLNLGIDGIWEHVLAPEALAERPDERGTFDDPNLLLGLIELLHADAVSRPTLDEEGQFEGGYDRERGREEFREAMAPILARLDPPLEMRASGQIVPLSGVGLGPLADHPLPASRSGDDVRGVVEDAVRLFRDRRSGEEDELAALARLAGIIEFLDEDGRLQAALRKKDNSALFNIANNYGIRHNNAEQMRNYGAPLREWIFHTYLAAIRLAVELAEQEGDDRPAEDA